MRRSTEYPMSVARIKRNLRKVGLSQNQAASLIKKSPGMVSMVLSGKAKSEPILAALTALIRERQAA